MMSIGNWQLLGNGELIFFSVCPLKHQNVPVDGHTPKSIQAVLNELNKFKKNEDTKLSGYGIGGVIWEELGEEVNMVKIW